MNARDIASLSHFHQTAIAEFGAGTVNALGWNSDASQATRFEVLSTLGDFTGRSLTDAGCGHADLLPYLSGRYPGLAYTGVEQLPVLLKVAMERYAHWPAARFVPLDFSEGELPMADYVIACGSLNYSSSDSNYIFTIIERLFAHSSIGFGFNLLSALQHPNDAIASYNPDTIHAFCKTLSSHTKLIQGYWENDFTILMYR